MADMKRGGSRGDSGDKEGRGMRPRRSRRKVCNFCADKIEHIEFKDVGKLRKFISERGKILPKRMSGNCARHQRELTIAVKRARHVALLPYSGE
jgi:small subunit ribosomal protein S18